MSYPCCPPSSCSCDVHITFAAGLLRSATRPLRCRSSSLLLSCRLRGLQGQAAQSSRHCGQSKQVVLCNNYVH